MQQSLSILASFLIIADLLKLAVENNRFDILPYSVFVLVFLFFVPFLAIKVRVKLGTQSDFQMPLSAYLQTTMQYMAYTVALTAIVLLFTTAFFVILNFGVTVAGLELIPRFLKESLGVGDPARFWVINPAALGIGVLELSALTIGVSFAADTKHQPNRAVFLSRRLWWLILIIAVLLNSMLAWRVVDSDALLYPGKCQTSESLASLAAMGVASIFTLLFLLAALCGVKLKQRLAGHKPLFSVMSGSVLFALFGTVAGLSIVLIKRTIGCLTPLHYHLTWMHAIGFVLAFLGIAFTSRFVAGRLSVRPLF